jgi:hypothetical protein
MVSAVGRDRRCRGMMLMLMDLHRLDLHRPGMVLIVSARPQ